MITCKDCVYFKKVEKSTGGNCLLNPPRLHPMQLPPSPGAPNGSVQYMSMWPAVPPDNFCSNYLNIFG